MYEMEVNFVLAWTEGLVSVVLLSDAIGLVLPFVATEKAALLTSEPCCRESISEHQSTQRRGGDEVWV